MRKAFIQIAVATANTHPNAVTMQISFYPPKPINDDTLI